MKRRKHTKEFKFKVAIEAIRGDMTIAQMVSKYQVSDGLIHKWRRQLLDQGSDVFQQGNQWSALSHDPEKERLHAKIGQLVVERDFLETALTAVPSRSARK